MEKWRQKLKKIKIKELKILILDKIFINDISNMIFSL